MKVSVIVAVYKDIKALELILDAIKKQTYKGDVEVVVAEDNDSKEMVEFLKNYKDMQIVHIQQPDTGKNKIIAQNKAIAKASGEYLIFLDGDIVPYRHFIEYSLKLVKPKRVLTGRRVNLPKEITDDIKNSKITPQNIEDNYWKFMLKHFRDKSIKIEQGIEFNPDGFLYKNFISKRKRNVEILGCNFSCFKEDMININGFDESYNTLSILADDTDLTWRFLGMGCELYSSKNIANCFHLWHPTRVYNNKDYNPKKDLELFEKNKQEKNYYCKDGLDKYLR